MALSVFQSAHLIATLATLLIAAHVGGFVFKRLRQPAVIGEILGGHFIGPTVLGALFPTAHSVLWEQEPATRTVVAALNELGLILLMFFAGSEMNARIGADARRTVVWITLIGTAVPMLVGVLIIRWIDLGSLLGPASNRLALAIVFGIAMAITSIPVISRIMLDLGMLQTPFARIVLATAVIEDVLLYVLLAVALSLVGGESSHRFGMSHALGLVPGSPASIAYHALAALGFLGMSLAIGPTLYRHVAAIRVNLLERSNPIAHSIVFLLLCTGVAMLMGVAAMLGAFVAGVIAGKSRTGSDSPLDAMRPFAFAFFIPIYFALVGARLDLLRSFDLNWFLFIFGLASFCKALSVYAGARIARQSQVDGINLAIALNARGGPGIVLASVAFQARIINEKFYAILVLLAIVTSLVAGAWLDFAVRNAELTGRLMGGRLPLDRPAPPARGNVPG